MTAVWRIRYDFRLRKTDVFRIENSKLQKSCGDGVKTVEFYYAITSVYRGLKSCPNGANRDESPDKLKKFEEYCSRYGKQIYRFAANAQPLCL